MKTQHERIISYLKTHRRAGITSLEAVIKLGIINLPGRISELPLLFRSESVKVPNRYGQMVTVKRYWLA